MIEVEMTSVSKKQITGINMKVQEFKFNESITFRVELFNDKNLVDIQFIEVAGEHYNKWNVDDDYIIDFVVENLGYRRRGERKVYKEPILEEDYLELSDELEEYKSRVLELTTRYEEEVLKVKMSKKNIDELTNQNNLITEKLSIINNEKSSFKLQLDSINSKYSDLNRSSEEKRKHYEFLIARIDELNVTNEELKAKLEEKSRENTVLQSFMVDFSDKREEYDYLKNRNIELEAGYSILKEESKRMDIVKSQYQNKIYELETELEASYSELDSCKSELTNIQLQLENHIANEDRLNSIVLSEEKNIQTISELNQSVSRLNSTLKTQSEYIEQLENDIDSKDDAISMLEEENGKKTNEIEKIKYDNVIYVSKLQQEILDSKRNIEEMNTELQYQIENYEKYIAEKEENIVSTNEVLMGNNETIALMRTEISELKLQIEIAQENLIDLENDKSELENTVSIHLEQISELISIIQNKIR